MHYVYCITNDFYEKSNTYKIGYTDDLDERLEKLRSSGVPGSKFYIKDVITVDTLEEARKAEHYLHIKLCDYRITFDREFFKVDNFETIEKYFNFLKGMDKIEESRVATEDISTDGKEVVEFFDANSGNIIQTTKAPIREGESISHLMAKKRSYMGREGEFGLSELFDNASDNHPHDGSKKKFTVGFRSNGNLVIENNCPGFKSKTQLLNFIKNDKWHIEQTYKTIGFNGGGWKDALRALADFMNNKPLQISDVKIYTSFDGKTMFIFTWHICADEKRYLKCEDIIEKTANGWIGTGCEIEHPTPFAFESVKDFFCHTYSHPKYRNEFDIYIQKRPHGDYYKIDDWKDSMYLEELGDKINEEGTHAIGGKFFTIKNHICRNEKENKIISFKTVSLFVPKEAAKKGLRTGIFEMWEYRYLGYPKTHPENDKLKFSKTHTNLLVIYENVETARAFGVGEIKSLGGVLFGNPVLDEFKDENGFTPSVILDKEYKYSLTTIYNMWLDSRDKLCIEDRCNAVLNKINDKIVIPTLSSGDIAKNEFAKKENNYLKGKDEKERIDNAIEEYNSLPLEARNNFDVKLKYFKNFGAIKMIAQPQKGSKHLNDFSYYYEYFPWALDLLKKFCYDREIERMFYYFTNGKTTFNFRMTGYLNDFATFAYIHFRDNDIYFKKEPSLEPALVTAETQYI